MLLKKMSNLKNHFQSVRTRRTKAKQEEVPQVINVEPEPFTETAPTAPVVEPAPIVAILNESDNVSTRANKPDKQTCNARGKVLSMEPFKYSHQKTFSGLKKTKTNEIRSQARETRIISDQES